ncbi:MAG: phosphomannomutase/phosphoglucomutase [Patescibacteria group bacterium]
MPVFHAYDIRGLSPEEIDSTFARRLARALVKNYSPRRVLVGRDMRRTSIEIEAALVAELTERGVGVVHIGLCSTPMFNVSVGLSMGNVDLGVMVTASHNPGIYNGFKIVRGDASPIGQGAGMEDLQESFERDARLSETSQKGTVTDDPAALSRYVDHIIKLAALPSNMPKMKIAIDAGNGMAGAILPELLSRLPWIETVKLFFEPDGNFPNHEANPLKRETLADLSAAVREHGCDFGVAFDGDADRIGFIDDRGVPVAGDIVTALLAKEIIRIFPGGLVLYDVRSSWSVPEEISAAGGRAKMCRVGHAYIKRQMRDLGAVFAGEISMHYYFHTLWFVESGDLVLLYLLRLLAREGDSLSNLWQKIAEYDHSEEINFKVDDAAAVIARLREIYSPEASALIEIDGIRREFRDSERPKRDWWFSIRASNTEPLVRLNVETRSPEETKKRVEELTNVILSRGEGSSI